MGVFPRAVLAGCLTASTGLSWLVAALLVLVIAAQQARGDQGASPVALAAAAAACVALGFGCRGAARIIGARPDA